MGGGDSPAGDGSGGNLDRVPLPPGSLEVDGIVNLVDADAARELEEYAVHDEPQAFFLRERLTKSVNLFLEHYPEEYDFIFLYTDHAIDGATIAGQFETINSPARPGTGNDIVTAVGGYKTIGRLKGAIVIPYNSRMLPPLPHEVLHYWANYLDPKFGFGVGLRANYGVHWGYAGVNGQLGGFDPESLRCATPSGERPPNCTAETNGRYRYTVGVFAPYTNGFRDVPYSRLELYLMGLIPLTEAPSSVILLDEAETIEPGSDTEPTVLEAAGVTEVLLEDIVATHGVVQELPESQRNFSAAFVIVSSAPAPKEVLARVASDAAVFGAREPSNIVSSFEVYTGGRATMTTLLGARRLTSDPAPPVRERFACDLVQQDCGSPELACYLWPPTICVLSGGVGLDAPCNAQFACAPGLVCVTGPSASSNVCKPFCDFEDPSSPKACETLCPGSFQTVRQNDAVLGAFCLPE